MKNRIRIFKLLTALCSVFAATAVFGTTFTWTGGDGTGTYIAAGTNWGGTLPNSANGDICQWDGTVAGNLLLFANAANGNLNNGTPGVSFNITAGQISSLSITSSVASSGNIALNGVSIANGAGAFSFGDTSANVLNLIMRPSSSGTPYPIHDWTNNSTSAATINANVRLQSGGGNPHIVIFDGTGNWSVTNNLIFANNTGIFIGKAGSGTLTWAGPSIAGAAGNSTINSPVDFEGGTVILTVGNPLTTQSITNNGTLLQYDAASQSQTLSGIIRGPGPLMVSAGTLTLSGANTYTGITTLTNNGALVLGVAHIPGTSGPIGIGGTIFFLGGTLTFSSANTFDYSTRFATSANQTYKFDTAGQSVTFATQMTNGGSTTLTKLGSGTLTLSGTNSYSGLATVSAGKLVFQGVKTGSGSITIANSTTIGVTDTGTQITPSTLTLGTSSGTTLEFNNVNSTTIAPLAATTLSTGGTVTINVNSGAFAVGQSYPLLAWTIGTPPTVTLGTLTGAGGNLSTNGNTIQLNITSVAYVWTGLNNANWDTTTANNWKVNGVSQIFGNGGTALFNDTATGQTNVTLNAAVSPASVTVSSTTNIYSITSSGANLIAGSGGLTKSGNTTLNLAGGVNTYSGATTISGGILSVGALANGGSPSDIGQSGSSAANLVLNGGTLQYNTNGSATSINRLFTLGTGGGTIDASGSDALSLTNTGSVALSGTGARSFTLTGANTSGNTLAATLADNGGATSLTKSGAGTWVLTGTNTYSGATTISGTLQVGTGGVSGSLGSGNVVNSGRLDFNVSSTLTNAGVISGNGSVTNDGSGTVILPGNNTYTGGTTINNGTLQVGNGGATGSLANGGTIVDNGTLIVNTTGSFNYSGSGLISGSGNVIIRGSGLQKFIGANSYTGWTLIEPGATFQPCEGNTGALASPVVTNNGTIKMVRQDAGVFIYSGSIVGSGLLWKDNNNVNVGDITLTGNNTYTGGTVIAGSGVIVGDGATSGWIVGGVIFTNSLTVFDNPRTLTFNRSDDVTFPGLITYSTNLAFGNRGIVAQSGSGTLTLTANNDYPGGSTINAGTLQIGNGGASGLMGTGPVTDNANLVWNRSGDVTFANVISGSGNLVKTGSGKLTLTNNLTYSGSTTVSNGILVLNGTCSTPTIYVAGGTLGGNGTLVAAITMDSGTTLAPGDTTTGTLTLYGSLNFNGNVSVKVNKSLAQSNDVVSVGSPVNGGTGTLTVANVGPALTVGDTFTLFSAPVSGGAALTVTGGGATWTNNLAVDGSITVLTAAPPVNTNPPVVRVSVSGNTLSLGWPTNLGWTLQTNTVGLTATNQWFAYPGSAAITNVNITINPAKTNVFFRMTYP